LLKTDDFCKRSYDEDYAFALPAVESLSNSKNGKLFELIGPELGDVRVWEASRSCLLGLIEQSKHENLEAD